MTKKALIHGTRICEVVDTPFEVSSDLSWVDVADNTVANQDTYVDGAVVKYSVPAVTWADIRARRDDLLSQSDWMAMPDSPAISSAWTTYRQALRDISTQSDPTDITWPTKPE
jgi:hypothetical protein